MGGELHKRDKLNSGIKMFFITDSQKFERPACESERSGNGLKISYKTGSIKDDGTTS